MIDLFKAPTIFRATFVKIVMYLLVQFQFIDKVLVYIKDEGSNVNTLENALSIVISCKLLEFKKPFSSTCFAQMKSKLCQYVITIEKVCALMEEISIKGD
jgi:hypothetical protein